MIQFSKVETKFYPLKGGLDLASPATMVDPGRCFDSQNYEIDSVNGGYARIRGFERYDGHASPSAANYWTITATITGTIAVGNTLTGGTSGATGKVLAIAGTTLVLGRITTAFISGETLKVGGVTQATSTSASVLLGEPTLSLDPAYRGLAANDLRTDIAVVPGSGSVLGVHRLNGVTYAFRNNIGGTAAVLYKSTASGWSAVTMYKEMLFSSGLVKPAEGSTVTGATSGATGVIKRVVTRTGAWGSTAAGSVVIDVTSGTFQNGEAIQITAVTQFTAASTANAIVLAPSGQYEMYDYNFTGSTATKRIYGCDGKNPAFEFDGTLYVPIHTGMTTDTPTHLAVHKNMLFLSFLGSVQNSAVGDPYNWTVVLGASEIAVGDDVTAMLPQPGDAATSALSIFTVNKSMTLYGSSVSDFKLVTASPTSGAEAFSAQWIGSATCFSQRGIQQITQTLNFGDFLFTSMSGLIQPLINLKLGTVTASAAFKERNQYRVFFSDGSAIAMTLNASEVTGFMPIMYDRAVKCYHVARESNGRESCWFGSTDGYVYQDNIGTSFDGNAYESWLRLPFNHFGSPRYRKQFRRAAFDMVVESYGNLSFSYELGSGDTAHTDSGVGQTLTITGGGGYWDQFTWDAFVWDAPAVFNKSIPLTGTEKNLSLLFYSNSATDGIHAIQGAHFHFTVRRIDRL